MRPWHTSALLLVVLAASAGAAEDKAPLPEPFAWGTMTHPAGCVIFEEGHQTRRMYWGIVITSKTFATLKVIETQNYALDKNEFLETQDELKHLMRRARTDHIKFVKIPEKYPPELLEKARAMCKDG